MNTQSPLRAPPGRAALAPVTMFGSRRGVTCGVSDYMRRLVGAIERVAPGLVAVEPIETDAPLAFMRAIVSRLRRGETVHLQLPIEGWGNSVLPGIALFLARLATRRGRIVLTLHEWVSLNPLRYASLVPDLLATDAFVFVSEQQRASFLRSPIAPRARREAAATIPLGPNIMPGALDEAEIAAERARIRADGTALAVGYFGVLYSAKGSSKQPSVLLDALAALRARGVPAKLVVCGDFLPDKQEDKRAFFARAEALGVAGALDFRGRIADERELMTALAACDVFLLPYVDGVSARRSTFHAVAQLARPLVTTTPERADEFDRHPMLARKIASPATVLVDPAAAPGAFADAIEAAHAARDRAIAVDLAAAWDEAARDHLALYERLARGAD